MGYLDAFRDEPVAQLVTAGDEEENNLTARTSDITQEVQRGCIAESLCGMLHVTARVVKCVAFTALCCLLIKSMGQLSNDDI
jgi:hypothetical protein